MFDVNDFHMVNHLVRNTFVLIGRVTKFSPTKILYIEDKILFSWEMAYEAHLWAHIWFTHENKFCHYIELNLKSLGEMDPMLVPWDQNSN